VIGGWGALDDDYIRTLCESIHDRIYDCLQSSGDRISY